MTGRGQASWGGLNVKISTGCGKALSAHYLQPTMKRESPSPSTHTPSEAGSTETVVLLPPAGKARRRVALQWLDGAGELHYETLSAELSQAYLVED